MKKQTGKRVGIVAVIACMAIVLVIILSSIISTNVSYNDHDAEYGATSGVNWLAKRSELKDFSTQNATNSAVTGAGGRIVMGSAQVNLQTKMYDACITAIKTKLKELDGYMDASDEQNYDSGRQAQIIARVPGKSLDAFIDSFTQNATVTSKTVSFSDVTDELLDTESKKKALETERDALLDLLKRAQSIEEIIKVQERLSSVRGDLEAYLAKLQDLGNKTKYSTVEISVQEVDRISTPSQKFGALAGSAFLASLRNIGSGFRNFAIWFISAIPYLVLLAIPTTVACVLYTLARKKRKQGGGGQS